jgi:hypothetical protein
MECVSISMRCDDTQDITRCITLFTASAKARGATSTIWEIILQLLLSIRLSQSGCLNPAVSIRLLSIRLTSSFFSQSGRAIATSITAMLLFSIYSNYIATDSGHRAVAPGLRDTKLLSHHNSAITSNHYKVISKKCCIVYDVIAIIYRYLYEA